MALPCEICSRPSARSSQFDASRSCIPQFGQQPPECLDRILVKLPDFHLHRGVGQQLPNSGDAQLQDALEQLSSFRKAQQYSGVARIEIGLPLVIDDQLGQKRHQATAWSWSF